MFSVTVSDVSEVSGFARFYEKFMVNLLMTFNCFGMDAASSARQTPDPILIWSGPFTGCLQPAQVVLQPHGPGLAGGIVPAASRTISPTFGSQGSSAFGIATPVNVCSFSYLATWTSEKFTHKEVPEY